MAFTYSTDLATDRDKIRLRIGDTVANAGPRPDKRNFDDAEIAFILSDEDDRVSGAIAQVFEILSNEWSAYALSERDSDVAMDATEVAKQFRAQAKIYRAKPGGSSDVIAGSVIVDFTRSDAWTAAAAAEY
jgi:hypothetical protein